jgi:hypothetical protein
MSHHSHKVTENESTMNHPPRLPLQHAERLRLYRAGIMGLVNVGADLTDESGRLITFRTLTPFPALKHQTKTRTDT